MVLSKAQRQAAMNAASRKLFQRRQAAKKDSRSIGKFNVGPSNAIAHITTGAIEARNTERQRPTHKPIYRPLGPEEGRIVRLPINPNKISSTKEQLKKVDKQLKAYETSKILLPSMRMIRPDEKEQFGDKVQKKIEGLEFTKKALEYRRQQETNFRLNPPKEKPKPKPFKGTL